MLLINLALIFAALKVLLNQFKPIKSWWLSRLMSENGKKGKPSRFGDTLEEKARGITKWLNGSSNGSPVSSIIKKDIALTLDQIEGLRNVHENIRKNLVRLECYIGTDLLGLKPKPHDYDNHHRSERNKLKDKLLKIEEERRRLSVEEEEKLQKLHEKLLSLMHKIEQLRLENG